MARQPRMRDSRWSVEAGYGHFNPPNRTRHALVLFLAVLVVVLAFAAVGIAAFEAQS